MNNNNRAVDANCGPLTGALGVHAVGTGIGVIVAGTAARAAVGAVAGPVGRVVVDGPAERGRAEAIDPARERAYWSRDLGDRNYVDKGSSFDDYGPAYRFGVHARGQYPGRDFNDVESEMSSDWAASRGVSILSWEWAKHAARDAWNRI